MPSKNDNISLTLFIVESESYIRQKFKIFVIMINMLSTCIVAILLFAPLVLSQQCRQVTVCNEESPNLMKGDKGDVGSSGKAGPVGSRGPKGEVGEKGMPGESCALGSFESTLMNKLAGIAILQDPKKRAS